MGVLWVLQLPLVDSVDMAGIGTLEISKEKAPIRQTTPTTMIYNIHTTAFFLKHIMILSVNIEKSLMKTP